MRDFFKPPVLALVSIQLLVASPMLASNASAQGNVEAGKLVFQRCAFCHAIQKDSVTRYGPVLQGIMDRPVASVEGYTYSPNMYKLGKSGARWDRETLNEFLSHPSEFVKGTKMTAPPVRRDSERQDLIEYLSTL